MKLKVGTVYKGAREITQIDKVSGKVQWANLKSLNCERHWQNIKSFKKWAEDIHEPLFFYD
jgi:hypothetical protein